MHFVPFLSMQFLFYVFDHLTCTFFVSSFRLAYNYSCLGSNIVTSWIENFCTLKMIQIELQFMKDLRLWFQILEGDYCCFYLKPRQGPLEYLFNKLNFPQFIFSQFKIRLYVVALSPVPCLSGPTALFPVLSGQQKKASRTMRPIVLCLCSHCISSYLPAFCFPLHFV